MKIIKLGCGLVILGILLFFISIYLFSYTGERFYGMITLGELSLVLWFPMIIFGIVVIAIGFFRNSKK